MRTEVKRLQRLAGCHGELVRLLEAQLISSRAELAELSEQKLATAAAMERTAQMGITIHAATFRRLVELEASIAKISRIVERLDQRLFDAKGRHSGLQEKAQALGVVLERKLEEDGLQEQLCHPKAKGKLGML